MAWTHDRARIARLHRAVDRDESAILDARRDLRASRAEVYLTQLLSVDPPLTVEQRDRLAGLLRPTDGAAT